MAQFEIKNLIIASKADLTQNKIYNFSKKKLDFSIPLKKIFFNAELEELLCKKVYITAALT